LVKATVTFPAFALSVLVSKARLPLGSAASLSADPPPELLEEELEVLVDELPALLEPLEPDELLPLPPHPATPSATASVGTANHDVLITMGSFIRGR
jgi:hypothetical protein